LASFVEALNVEAAFANRRESRQRKVVASAPSRSIPVAPVNTQLTLPTGGRFSGGDVIHFPFDLRVLELMRRTSGAFRDTATVFVIACSFFSMCPEAGI
jgi:hypothetical protein